MDDVADSTDWLSTPLSGLAPLESGLRCQVCKDFFTTPMITSCSHTFCSLCIRRYLSQEGRCPACRESDQELKLRRNWAMEEVVAHFTQARDEILKFARQPAPVAESSEETRPKKRRKIAHRPTETNGEVSSRRSTRSQSKRVAVSASQASQEAEVSQGEIPDSEDEGSVYDESGLHSAKKLSRPDSRTVKEPNDGLVECPCCTRRMKETAINAHLDRCVNGLPTSPEPSSVAVSNGSLAFVQRTKSPTMTSAKDRLPSINYALFTDTSLRKKLKELGIPNHGSKELMRKRHTEWMNLWNANCDALRPRPKRELLRDLDIWERTLGKQLEKTVAAGGASGVMVKDFDRDGWMKTQKTDFDDLIQKARERGKATARAKEQSADKSEDGEKDKDVAMTETTAGEDQPVEKSMSNGHITTQPEPDSLKLADAIENDGSSMEGRVPEIDTARDQPPQASRKSETSVPSPPVPIELASSPVRAGEVQANGVENGGTPKTSRFFV